MSELLGVMASSMTDDMNKLNAVAHNMANVSTTGFKRTFSLGNEGAVDEGPRLTNQGTRVDMRQGPLSHTGSDLDLAIEGNGFFEVNDGDARFLTRGGAMRLDSRGRLVTSQSGLPVAGEAGEIFLGPGSVQIDADGWVLQKGEKVARLKLVALGEKPGLEAAGNGLYRLNRESNDSDATRGRIRQGYLEMSNVSSTREMVELMELTRHFEAVQKGLHGMDAMWDKTLRSLGEF